MKLILALYLTLNFLSYAHCSDESLAHSNIEISKNFEGNRWDNIYFSGQPSEETLQDLQKNGFKTIINLRNKQEGDYKESWEKALASKQGFHYYNIPFSMDKDLDDNYIEKITSLVSKHRKEGKVLIHCSSGNRVAVWLGGHFKKDHHFSNEKSFELATKLGLKKDAAKEKLKKYLESKK
ncbi:MAG: dual specificity protein phosphatase family protein [Halobacteriovoraceae bacterium]|nr:dual specificity protein phosphatase family protein [Halobacteriovoraceae bacterium]MCB9095336.1 dual specificity protein phosphatase family protein [Halobacteriovoraceae bacterium]